MPIESLSNPFGSFRMGLYPPGGIAACNFTTYTNPTTEESVNVPFVPCGQAYVLGEQITILGQPMTVLGE